MTDNGAGVPAWRRRVLQDLAASARPEADTQGDLLGYAIVCRKGDSAWMSWLSEPADIWRACDVADQIEEHEHVEAVVCELRAVDRNAIRERRKAAGELTALTEELGLYGGAGERQ